MRFIVVPDHVVTLQGAKEFIRGHFKLLGIDPDKLYYMDFDDDKNSATLKAAFNFYAVDLRFVFNSPLPLSTIRTLTHEALAYQSGFNSAD